MSPADIDTVARSISPLPGEPRPFDTGELTCRLQLPHELFWKEHEAFILVPFIHYLRRDTVS